MQQLRELAVIKCSEQLEQTTSFYKMSRKIGNPVRAYYLSFQTVKRRYHIILGNKTHEDRITIITEGVMYQGCLSRLTIIWYRTVVTTFCMDTRNIITPMYKICK
jgi:hypothetical protein